MKSTAPKMIMRGGSANDSMNTLTLVFACLAVLAVVPGRGQPGFELAPCVARDHAIEVVVAERTRRRAVGADQQLGAEVRAVDHRRERDRLTGAQRVAQFLVPAHQSRGSTKRRIVPPHVSPTAKASSSE